MSVCCVVQYNQRLTIDRWVARKTMALAPTEYANLVGSETLSRQQTIGAQGVYAFNHYPLQGMRTLSPPLQQRRLTCCLLRMRIKKGFSRIQSLLYLLLKHKMVSKQQCSEAGRKLARQTKSRMTYALSRQFYNPRQRWKNYSKHQHNRSLHTTQQSSTMQASTPPTTSSFHLRARTSRWLDARFHIHGN